MTLAQTVATTSELSTSESQYYRRQLARHLTGRGIELGALHAPTEGLPADSLVYYVDKESTQGLASRFASDGAVAPESLAAVDVVADASRLPFAGQLDFLIANHVIEHLPNPLGALEEWYLCLKDGGLLFLTVPDKRFCFDADRELTSWSHLVADLEASDDGLTEASGEHLREWVRVVEGASEEVVEERVEYHVSTALDYHCHTWTHESLLGMLDRCGRQLGLRFNRDAELSSYETWGESILVLRKDRDAPDILPAEYRYPEWQFDRKDRILGELLAGMLFEQWFTCVHPDLNSIHVRFGVYSRTNSGPLVFRLFEEAQGSPAAHVEVDLSELRDNVFHSFRFPPVKKSAGRRFRFTLEAPVASPDNAVTVWAEATEQNGVSFVASGEPVRGTTLNFKAFSRTSLKERDAWSGQRVTASANLGNGWSKIRGTWRWIFGREQTQTEGQLPS